MYMYNKIWRRDIANKNVYSNLSVSAAALEDDNRETTERDRPISAAANTPGVAENSDCRLRKNSDRYAIRPAAACRRRHGDASLSTTPYYRCLVFAVRPRARPSAIFYCSRAMLLSPITIKRAILSL